MQEREAHKFAVNCARKFWDHEESESAAGIATMQFLAKQAAGEVMGNQYSMLKTIVVRRCTDVMRTYYGRRSADDAWPTVAVNAGGSIPSEQLDLSRQRTEQPVGIKHPLPLSFEMGEDRDIADLLADDDQEADIESVLDAHDSKLAAQGLLARCTERERSLILMLADGKTLAEAGSVLGITESGASLMRKRVRNKVRVA